LTKSLKNQNTPRLFFVVAANVLVFTAIVFGVEWIQADSEVLSRISTMLPLGLALVFVGVVNAIIGPKAKARLVFWRWDHPLPGSEAFTRYAHEDHRVDLVELEKKYGPLPDDPSRQNNLWYKLYQTVQNEPSVIQAHKEFLFCRDYTALSLYMLAGFGAVGFIMLESNTISAGYFILLLLQYLLAISAARNHGRSLVTNVLALVSAGKGGVGV
jgi:hypothetical protein